MPRESTNFRDETLALPIGSQRSLFDIPSGVAYFNTAYNAPLLNASRTRLVSAVSAKSHPWERTSPDFFADAERMRQLAASLFGGDVDGYSLIPAASYGLSAAARAIEPTLRPGDRIVLLADEFPSNVYPWRRTANETGAVVTTVPTPVNGDWTAATLEVLASGARVASLGGAHWTNGARVDLSAIGDACRAAGITLVLDMTQSLGAMPFDMTAVQPDFCVAAGYKWLLCPYGIGLMYVGPAWRNARPLEESWLTRSNAADFTSLANYSDDYMPGARRFDVGEKCTASLPGAVAALEQVQEWGVARVAASLADINGRIQTRLESLGFELPPPGARCPHMFGARVPAHWTGDVVGALRAQQVFVSQRASSIRFAPHLHVTEADIDQLFAALATLS
ncbi:MAG: aminotransferase class V-fold PLP-dependent enzyme [bacterium]